MPQLDEFEVGKLLTDMPQSCIVEVVAVKVDPLELGPAIELGEGMPVDR